MLVDSSIPTQAKSLMKEKFVHISHDTKTNILYVKWIGFLRLEDVKKAGKFLLEYVAKNRITLNLNDQTELKVLSTEVQQYLMGELFPAIERVGMKKVGVLLSEDLFAQASVGNVNAKVGLQVQVFGNANLCTEWLLK